MTELAHHTGSYLVPIVVLLIAAIIAVPLFKRLGLGSVLGYLAAGLVMGPSGLGFFSNPQAIMHVAELGVIMFLFTIGLEMQPSRLWAMRGDIFGLGLAQVASATVILTAVGVAAGLSFPIAFVAGAGFVLTSTAIVVQMLDEQRALSTDIGPRMVAILLLEDLAIVPLLALVAFMAPAGGDATLGDRLIAILIGTGAIAGLVAAGRWLLNPLFRLLAATRAREVMTAASLLVVVGAAWVLQLGGLSMALGAFLAGVLLSGSVFRHQLEADVAPFRGILLGLFFVSVGMTLDLDVVTNHWRLIGAGVSAYMALKGVAVYAVGRLFGASNDEALRRTALMAQGGEFAFVLYSTAVSVGIFDATASSIATAIVVISMVATPVLTAVAERVPRPSPSMKGVEPVGELDGEILLVGFGRFGHIASQPLLDQGYSISIIDSDPQMIRDAADFGFKVYFGDGARLDILEAAGAARAKAILICVDGEETALKIAEIVTASFPMAPVLARAKHREHAFDLINAGVTWQIRDTLESAFAFGEHALEVLGAPSDAIAETMKRVRHDDAERFEIQRVGGLYAGLSLIRGNVSGSDSGQSL